MPGLQPTMKHGALRAPCAEWAARGQRQPQSLVLTSHPRGKAFRHQAMSALLAVTTAMKV